MNAPEPYPPHKIPSLRIALLGYRSHPHVGGQGIYLNYLSKALTDLGHQVDVISGPPYPVLDDERVRLIELPSLDLYASANPSRELRWRHLLSWADSYEYFSKLTGGFAEPYAFCRRAAAYLAKHRDDYDLVHDNQSLGYGLLDIQSLGLPVVATVHHPITQDLQIALSQQSDGFMRLLTRRWYRFLKMQVRVAKKLPYLVTVSECSKADIAQAFAIAPERLCVIANGVDTQVFRPKLEILKQPQALITTASSDLPLKGQKFLLQAVASLRQQFKDLSLTVIGQLRPGSQTEQLLNDMGLHDCVTFKSQLSSEQLADEYSRAAVAVTPSLYEGFGLPAAEAMACGTAVVSTDGGALPEVVADAGVIVPKADSTALATAIAELLSDDQRRRQLSQGGVQRITTLFSWHAAARKYSEYYQQVLQAKDAQVCIPSTITT